MFGATNFTQPLVVMVETFRRSVPPLALRLRQAQTVKYNPTSDKIDHVAQS